MKENHSEVIDSTLDSLINNQTDFKFKRRKNNGTPYRTKQDMIEDYNKTVLFYPFSVLWNMDYCSTIVKSHMKNSLFFAFPFTFLLSYALNPQARSGGLSKRPFAYYITTYFTVYTCLSIYFLIDSFLFCDYCKPWSEMYSINNGRESYKNLLKDKIKREQKSTDVAIRKTRDIGLSDDEI